MISGKEFQEFCNWNLCNRYTINFEPTNIRPGDFIFINLDTFDQFTRVALEYNIKGFNLISHNSDRSFTQNHFSQIEPIVNHIYTINCIFKNDKITKIPLGFSDRLVSVISNMESIDKKDDLLYVNFNIHSGRISERTECRSYFTKFDWITFEDLVTESQYYQSLSKSKYCVCPIGAGLDTHRFYESIYFNTIPIVKRNEISDLHEKFPCIIVNDWDEVNYESLNRNYQSDYDNLLNWKNNNDWSHIKFWLK